MDICFGEISSFKGITYSQLNNYRYAWNTFNRIEKINSNVSTLHGNSNFSLSYYTFIDQTEKNMYDTGLSLHVQYSGPVVTVQKN
jgi:hypothetical protein